MLVLKTLLIIPILLLSPNNRFTGYCSSTAPDEECHNRRDLAELKAIVTVSVIVAYSLWSWILRPYWDSKNDSLDSVGRLSLLLISFVGLIPLYTTSVSPYILGTVLNLFTSFAAIYFVAMMLSEANSVRFALKNFRKSLVLTRCRSSRRPRIFSDAFSLRQARKERIWHEFWDVLFQQDSEYQVPCRPGLKAGDYQPVELSYEKGYTPPYLLNFRGTIGERHAENKEIVSFESAKSVSTKLTIADVALSVLAVVSVRGSVEVGDCDPQRPATASTAGVGGGGGAAAGGRRRLLGRRRRATHQGQRWRRRSSQPS